MSSQQRAVELVAAIDRLLESLQVRRLQRRGVSVQEFDVFAHQFGEVHRLALLAGFSEPPPISQAELQGIEFGPTEKAHPNRDAGKQFERQLVDLHAMARELAFPAPATGAMVAAKVTGRGPSKRSTERGEGQAKLIAALTKHHRYAASGCLIPEPIGNNELAKAAGVSPSTASAFFNDNFQGHTKYKALCRDAGKLAAALKLLNGEFAPYHLLGDSSSNLAASEEEDTDAE
jgi:hypothetical protein